MQKQIWQCLLSLMLTTPVGCVARKFNHATPQHIEGQPTRDNAPWMWARFPRELYLEAVLGIPPQSEKAKTVLPPDHPATATAQFWIDRIHERFVAKNPQAMANVPKPSALVIADTSPNAFVAGGSYCFDVDVAMERLPLDRPGNKYAVLDSMGVLHLSERPAPCTPVNPFGPRMGEIADWITSRMNGKCTLRWDQGKLIISQCPVLESQFETNEKPRGLALTGSADWIVFHSGMFADTTLPAPFSSTPSSDRFVAVVAHELTHYYRTHQMLFPGEYNYWYIRPTPTRPEKPARTEDPAVLDEARRVVTDRRPNGDAIPGQRTSPQMFAMLRNIIVSNLGTRFNSMWNPEIKALLQGVPASCWNAYSLAQSDGKNDYPFVLGYPRVKPQSETERSLFLDVESVFLQCASEMKIGFVKNLETALVQWNGRELPSNEAFPYVHIDRVVGTWANRSRADAEADLARSRQTLGEVMRNINRFDLPIINQTIKQYFPNAGCEHEIPEAAAGQALSEVILTIEARLQQASADYVALLNKVRRNKVGFYTVEEEADSMAIEALALLGIPLEAAVESQFEILTISEKYRGHDPLLDYGPEQCIAMHREGWTEPPFLGTVTDTHHGGCYRVYSAVEEIKAHRYPMGSRVNSPIAWNATVQAARDFEKQVQPVDIPPQQPACRVRR